MEQLDVVTNPEPFPNPIIRKAQIRNLEVLVSEDVGFETKTALVSSSGQVYELGTQLKKAIFGQVIHALLITPMGDDRFMRSDRQMAIKVYSKKKLRLMQGKTQENPLMEITALQYIGDEHPNIMGQIECCTDDDNIYSVMRYCNGGELFDYIDENGPMTEEQAREMFRQLLEGLSHLQRLGIGHRDMSLENILYDSDERYVIIDFGMCLRLRYNPENGQFCKVFRQTICGKRNYISPEVLSQEESFNPMLCDIWAAGVILFILLTGLPPVDTASVSDDRFNMIRANRLADMLAAWNIDLSHEVVDLIQSILRVAPSDRLTIDQIKQHPWMQQ